MKTRYIILIIVSLLLIAFGVGTYLNFITERNRQDDLIRRSKLFVNKWATFKDGASDEYLAKIKPYVSDEIYTDYKDSAEEIKTTRKNGGKVIESVFIYKSEPVITKDGKNYKVTVDGERSYIDYKRFDQKIFITWSPKDKESYIITELYTEDK